MLLPTATTLWPFSFIRDHSLTWCPQCASEDALHTELALELVECLQAEGRAQQPGRGAEEAALLPASSRALSEVSMEASLSALEDVLVREEELRGGAYQSNSIRDRQRRSAFLPTSTSDASIPAGVRALMASEIGPMDKVPRALRLRSALLLHLYRSHQYDPAIVLMALGPLPPLLPPPPPPPPPLTTSQGAEDRAQAGGGAQSTGHSLPLPASGADTAFHLRERVLLLSRLGDHASALHVLAFYMGDIGGCMEYCRRQQRREALLSQAQGESLGPNQREDGKKIGAGRHPDCWLSLLELLLRCVALGVLDLSW